MRYFPHSGGDYSRRFLEFPLEGASRGETIDPLHMRTAVVTFFNCNDAIVAFRIFLIALYLLRLPLGVSMMTSRARRRPR